MDNKFAQWQQAYQDSTPQINTKHLLEAVTKANKRERWKALADLVLGVVVSLYCVYAFLVHADTFSGQLLFAVLVPVPIAFGVWSFRMRKQHLSIQCLNVEQLLMIKRQQLYTQIKYWRVSSLGLVLLCSGAAMVGIYQYLRHGSAEPWLLILGVQSVVLIATASRFFIKRARLPERLAEIEALKHGE